MIEKVDANGFEIFENGFVRKRDRITRDNSR